jgi:hypothetical protein
MLLRSLFMHIRLLIASNKNVAMHMPALAMQNATCPLQPLGYLMVLLQLNHSIQKQPIEILSEFHSDMNLTDESW